YIENKKDLQQITEKTKKFLSGFYSDFALELLSSVDYIVCKEKTFNNEIIYQKFNEWNDRKRSLFSNLNYIDISLKRIKTFPSL
ncbi:MAG: Appr-1-p processing protein, partial [Spirochaetia bacterium]|nr:Appr-1-p processing protein [Spirochaetia bacterium]